MKNKVEDCKCSKPLYQTLLKVDSDAAFYTGCPCIESFNDLHEVTSPFMKRKWKGKSNTVSKIIRKFRKSPKKLGRKTKLTSQDELLLTLMKLRLGLMEKDLSDRFNVSSSVISSTFITWVKVIAHVLKPLIFVPNRGMLNFTTPVRFNHIKEMNQILDCFEVFIETPKNPDLQKVTWSEYKHHNTMKFLVSCTPNSSVSFISLAYPGSISDKKIVSHSNFLDCVPMYAYIMADKGFNIETECLARNITLYVPPGKRGSYQMLPSEIHKTKRIANLRILIEQVIRQMKGFKILAQEFPIRLLSNIDDICTVCAALVNLKQPIYDD